MSHLKYAHGPRLTESQYLTPVIYGFEAIVVTEFGDMAFDCVDSAIVPSGPAYQDTALQTCAYAGAQPGQAFINGADYYNSYYGFNSNHLWRNIGIIIGMTLAYALLSLFLLEVSEWSSGAASGVKFSKSRPSLNNKTDIEAGPATAKNSTLDDTESQEAQQEAVKGTTSIFTWKNLSYDVPVGGSQRRLLDEVSGYCKPGEMTALVGCSGAGKSTRELIRQSGRDQSRLTFAQF